VDEIEVDPTVSNTSATHSSTTTTTTGRTGGFLPLLFSSLTPYVIVGLFLASIIVLSWLATVVVLPALVTRRK
jgi:predicted RND superfamily exporter protein